jgi:D-apionolactonase
VQPWYDQQDGGMVFPAFHVMAGLSELGGGTLLSVEISGADSIAAIAAEKDGHATLWIANLTARTHSVQLSDAPSGARIALLGADEFERAATDPNFIESSARPLDDQFISLDAYAVARVELDRSSSTWPDVR